MRSMKFGYAEISVATGFDWGCPRNGRAQATKAAKARSVTGDRAAVTGLPRIWLS
jgi:hypothetical protein